jgi:hypothetical protein
MGGAARSYLPVKVGGRQVSQSEGWRVGSAVATAQPPPQPPLQGEGERARRSYCGFNPIPFAIMLRMICEVPATTVAMRESR